MNKIVDKIMALADEYMRLCEDEIRVELRAAIVEALDQGEPVAWQHESKECSLGAAGMHNIITTPVRDLWLKANPVQIEHYTRPLYAAKEPK